jgi:hypothetical protein
VAASGRPLISCALAAIFFILLIYGAP